MKTAYKVNIILVVVGGIVSFFWFAGSWRKDKYETGQDQVVPEIQMKVVDSSPPAKMLTASSGSQTSSSEMTIGEFGAATEKNSGPPKTVVTAADVPSRIRVIWGLESDSGYSSRKAAVQALGSRLNREEVESLYAFLKQREDMFLPAGLELNSIKNDIMAILTQQETMPDDLPARLIQMSKDPGIDEMLRDYAIQYFYHGYKGVESWSDTESAAQARADILNAYWEFTSHPQESLAGTALLGLHLLEQDGVVLDFERKKSLIYSMLASEDVNVSTRITALGMCGSNSDSNLVSVIRVLAETSPDSAVRMAAKSALGRVR